MSRTSAAALAVDDAVFLHSDDKPKSVRLVKYSVRYPDFENFEDVSENNGPQRMEYLGVSAHVFDFEIDGARYVSVVDGTDVGTRLLE